MTESERLDRIKNAALNPTETTPEFQAFMDEVKAEVLAEDFVIEHGLAETTKEDVLDEAENLDGFDRDEDKVDFDQDENEIDMENRSSFWNELSS